MKNLILLVVFTFALIGCGEMPVAHVEVDSTIATTPADAKVTSKNAETPEQSVTNALNAIKKLDMKTAQKYLSTDEALSINSNKELLDGNSELMFQNISFKILDSTSGDNISTVKTEITNINLELIFAEYVQQTLAAAMANAFVGDNKISDEELQKQAEKNFVDLLKRKGNGTVTSTVNIKLTKQDDIWKIESDESFQDALLGGMVTAAKNMQESFKNSGWVEK